MVFERYERMKDIFDDVLWAHHRKVNTDGDFQDLFEHLAKRNEKRGAAGTETKARTISTLPTLDSRSMVCVDLALRWKPLGRNTTARPFGMSQCFT